MLKDRLTTEQLVKRWMVTWKEIDGSQSVTISVVSRDAPFVIGQTSALGTDTVTFHR